MLKLCYSLLRWFKIHERYQRIADVLTSPAGSIDSASDGADGVCWLLCARRLEAARRLRHLRKVDADAGKQISCCAATEGGKWHGHGTAVVLTALVSLLDR
jgi:hypothetical protein